MSDLLQRARDIAADAYLAREAARTIPVIGHTPEQWAQHVERYANYTRTGMFDDGELVDTALAALKSIDVPGVLLAVIDATRAYLPPDGISEQECINRILSATDNRAIAHHINAAYEARGAA